ncbi:MAG TPA: MG2 domain-containing protein, partial [Longimicrobiales bacterium]|nr:MG2 domain-containing protein [Longimicrobiales bacterium]
MQPIKLALLFAVLNQIAPAGGPLRVLRVHPDTPADPLTEITVTFDRPVAGSLDGTVAADRIFRIEPAVAGKVEWRDPTTLRFVPAAPLPPGATYTVTIANTFAAMDGSELQQPHTFSFRVEQVKIITGDPLRPHENPLYITATPTFRLLLSGPADPRQIAMASYVTMSQACGGARVPVNLVQMRRVTAQDPSILRYATMRGYPADSLRDLRRVLELRPAQRLPLNCPGALVLPAELGDGQTNVLRFNTHGPLRISAVRCGVNESCPTGPIVVAFTTPVRGAELMRRVRIAPALPYTVRDTAEAADTWTLDVKLQPRQHYAVVFDSLLTDVFGQKLQTLAVKPLQTTSYAPTLVYGTGRMLVERQGFRTLAVQAVNLDTLIVTSIAVPDTAEVEFLSRSWNWEEPFQAMMGRATRRKIGVRGQLDQPVIVGVPFPAHDARTGRTGTLVAVKVERPGGKPGEMRGIALLQVTDLAVHARIGIDEGWVWVTGVRDGRPRANALVTLYGKSGKTRATARTNVQGLARLTNYRPVDAADRCEGWCGGFEGYVSATLNDDRAVVGLSTYDPDLGPWSFDIWAAWNEEQRMPAAVAVFTERGIYRPGERVYAKAIVRRGTLGSLAVPARTDSLKWTFKDREAGVLKEATVTLSAFGTAHQTLTIGADQPLGIYQVSLALRHQGAWQTLGSTTYQVAEYRPPEFLVEVNADQTPRFAGDRLSAQVSARYLFGAPMAKAPVRWIVQQRPLFPWDLEIPNVDEWTIGGVEDYDDIDYNAVQVMAEGTDTLDAGGAVALNIPLRAPANGLGARTGIVAMVTDANRQTVSAGSSVIVHPAAFYVAAKVRGKDYFWRAGTPVTVDLIAVRPNGERVSGVDIAGTVVRR